MIATGTPALDSIVNDCLGKGVISKAALELKNEPESIVAEYFKDSDYSCEKCEKIKLKDKTDYLCTANPICYHKINNSEIESIAITSKRPIYLFQFYFSVLFKNKLRKNEEHIIVLVDDLGAIHEKNILDGDKFTVRNANYSFPINLFDKAKSVAEEHLDTILKDKQLVFDLMLNSQVTRRLSNLEKRLDEEKLEKNITNRGSGFDQKEWENKKMQVLKQETESLKTAVSVKFNNLLVVKTFFITFNVSLRNGSKIASSIVLGLDDEIKVICPECGKLFSEGYATDDGAYLCKDCINQSVESHRLYSKHYELQTDYILNEYLEKNEGFICPVCQKTSLKFLGVQCSWSNKTVCINCSTKCDKCGKFFSSPNTYLSKESGKFFCIHHTVKCDNCGSTLGIDEYKLCKATGKKFCSCMKFAVCSFCEQIYSSSALFNEKCPACNRLHEGNDLRDINPVLLKDPSKGKTKRWLVGKNALNTVLVAKGLFSDTLYVVEEGVVVHQRNLSFVEKLRRS